MTQEKYADRIAKLLRKAETTTPEEAELLCEKAQQLMTLYAIDEAMIAKARGENAKTREKIVEARWTHKGSYHMPLMDLTEAVARANDVRVLHRKMQNAVMVYVVGHESDVENVRMLDTSLQIQAARSMRSWYKALDTSWMSDMQRYKARREFMFGFAAGVGYKLLRARSEGIKQSSETHTSDSVSLVLRDKKGRVDDWIDSVYGKIKAARNRQYSSGGHDAHMSGRAAGQRADVGDPRLGGGRKELNR